MLHIANSPPPSLLNASLFSDEFNEFLAGCLIKDPGERPSASTLLQVFPKMMHSHSYQQHKFILSAKECPEALFSMVEEASIILEQYGGSIEVIPPSFEKD
jgi:serine/threonine protein kinase